MYLVRFQWQDEVFYGKVNKNKQDITVLQGDFPDFQKTGKSVSLAEVDLLAPCQPSKVLCLGLNYRDHAREFHQPIPESPVVFMKPSTAVTHPNAPILYPAEMSQQVDYEGELAVVIGKTAKDVAPEDAGAYIFGYTCGNDVTARDLQPKNGQWTISKSFDSFLPLGPWIVTDVEPGNLKIETFVNGQLKQSSSTCNLIFPVPYLVSYLSRVMTLLPGDVILTGTPSGVGPLLESDQVSVVIEGIGQLDNHVVIKD